MQKTNYLKYLKLLFRPSMIGVAGSTIWYFTHTHMSVSQEDQGVFESILGIFGGIHVLIASFQIIKVVDQYNKILQALHNKNKLLFEENICLRINPGIKFLLGICSAIIFILFLLYPFATTYAGTLITGFILFGLYLLWEIASELDEPYNGITKITRVQVEETFPEKEIKPC